MFDRIPLKLFARNNERDLLMQFLVVLITTVVKIELELIRLYAINSNITSLSHRKRSKFTLEIILRLKLVWDSNRILIANFRLGI